MRPPRRRERTREVLLEAGHLPGEIETLTGDR
jgi:hypothetical protein